MKRIIFCFDGTSNEIDTDEPTNVLLLASGIANNDKNIDQIIYYKKGVGTVKGREKRDGATGKGLYDKIKEAYEFLCFNYSVGDEIFIFGFSRGAYTARSFSGFIYLNGITKRAKIEKILDADKAYRESGHVYTLDRDTRFSRYNDRLDDAVPVCCSIEEQYYRLDNYRSEGDVGIEDFPLINIKYLGVWDTVKTLTHGDGEDEHNFHIDKLSPIIRSARHAVSLDEYRKEFDVTLFNNIDEMNELAFSIDRQNIATAAEYKVSPQRHYQEVWFPGGHGSTGGGGDIKGLSDQAFLWVLEGAVRLGLKVDSAEISKIFKIQPDPRASLDNTKKDGVLEKAWNLKARINGHIRSGPKGLHEVSRSTILRIAYSKYDEDIDDFYNPPALSSIWSEVNSASKEFSAEDFELCLDYSGENFNHKQIRDFKGQQYYIHRVSRGEYISGIARDWLGDWKEYKIIIQANKVMIPENGEIQAGQYINLPLNDFLKRKLHASS